MPGDGGRALTDGGCLYLVIYRGGGQVFASTKLTGAPEQYTVQSDLYHQFYDDSSQLYSVCFGSVDAARLFAESLMVVQICVFVAAKVCANAADEAALGDLMKARTHKKQGGSIEPVDRTMTLQAGQAEGAVVGQNGHEVSVSVTIKQFFVDGCDPHDAVSAVRQAEATTLKGKVKSNGNVDGPQGITKACAKAVSGMKGGSKVLIIAGPGASQYGVAEGFVRIVIEVGASQEEESDEEESEESTGQGGTNMDEQLVRPSRSRDSSRFKPGDLDAEFAVQYMESSDDKKNLLKRISRQGARPAMAGVAPIRNVPDAVENGGHGHGEGPVDEKEPVVLHASDIHVQKAPEVHNESGLDQSSLSSASGDRGHHELAHSNRGAMPGQYGFEGSHRGFPPHGGPVHPQYGDKRGNEWQHGWHRSGAGFGPHGYDPLLAASQGTNGGLHPDGGFGGGPVRPGPMAYSQGGGPGFPSMPYFYGPMGPYGSPGGPREGERGGGASAIEPVVESVAQLTKTVEALTSKLSSGGSEAATEESALAAFAALIEDNKKLKELAARHASSQSVIQGCLTSIDTLRKERTSTIVTPGHAVSACYWMRSFCFMC